MLLVLATTWTWARQAPSHPIPEQEIAALQNEFDALNTKRTSRTGMRRDLKNMVRGAQALLDASPQAPNRFVVLELIFQSQKRLLGMDVTEQNREEFFATCRKLVQAPDPYAEIRLEADMLLSEKQLAEKNATAAERAEALEELIARYRGTSGEAKSLMLGVLIARRLDAPGLEGAIMYAMEENFSDDPEVIEFRRKHLSVNRLDLSFKGTFERNDGTELRFPADSMGHMSLMVFWSKDKPGLDEYLDGVKKQLEAFGDRVDVFSFNLDELPDAGEAILRDKGLDWTLVRLPGGRNHQAYRTYPTADPNAVLVNEYGFTVISPEIVHGRMLALEPARVSVARYMAQLQSLFIGDFLVTPSADNGDAGKNPAADEVFRAIQDCFPSAPFRFRLSREETLENYKKAERLCREAIEQNPPAENLWWLRNRRIIALLGLWNLACEPRYLEKAVTEARAALATELPPGADVVPRFCLAKDTLRQEADAPESVLADFIEEAGGQDAPASALAAAAVLALDARSRELHETYRQAFLGKHVDNPDFYAFTAFLRNRHHRYRLLRVNYALRERGARGYIVNHGGEPMIEPMPTIELKKPNGDTLTLPRRNTDKMTLLVFVEPPPEPGSDFPVKKDGNGKPTRNDHVRSVMDYAVKVADEHVNNGVELVTAFLCDDTSRVDELMKKNGWTNQAAAVPGGLENSMVRQLGILSADRVANVFLLRRDGTIAWRASGLPYQDAFGQNFAFLLAMKVHIEACEVETGYAALEQGKFEEAVRIFSGPYLPWNPDRYSWRGPRYHGKALALMGLKDWEAALEAIQTAIDAHTVSHYRGREPKRAEDWRYPLNDFTIKEPCDVLALLWGVKADILDKLGRKDEAAEMRKKAEQPVKPDGRSVYSAFHERLKDLRLHPKTEL